MFFKKNINMTLCYILNQLSLKSILALKVVSNKQCSSHINRDKITIFKIVILT